MSWEMVDEGWGRAATVWAYTAEPRSRPEYEAVLDALDVGPDHRYLDIACGSGFAAQLAGERRATVCGIDASNRLLAIAEARTPEGDFRYGDMHAMPWGDAGFDTATSFRGIWGNTPAAVIEAARVLKPGGKLGLTFWPADIMESPTAEIWMALVPTSKHERAQMAGMGSIAVGGRVEDMCRSAGLVPGERARIEFVTEAPTIDFEVDAMLASGPAFTAVAERGEGDVRAALRTAITPMLRDGLGVRIPVSIEYLVAEKPS